MTVEVAGQVLGVADSYAVLTEDMEEHLCQCAFAASFDAAHDDSDLALLGKALDQIDAGDVLMVIRLDPAGTARRGIS